MIPRRLQLKNFLSYGPQTETIDFSSYRLICLSGKNGHGKSALLDAITWSLWGQARKVGATSKPDQGILRLGQVEMMVCFDFEFNKQMYRVRRDFSKKYGKPHVHVEFGMLDPEDEHFISLTDKTVRKTQAKIEQTLGLDYETFTNSSFLRQGNANEFSKKSAKERKEILSTILGLHQYDKAKACALEKTRALSTQITHLEKMKELSLQELETLKTVKEQQKNVAKTLEEITTQEQTLTTQNNDLINKKEFWNKENQALKLLTYKKEQLEIQHTKERQTLNGLVNQWKKTHKNLLALPDPKELEKEHKQTIETVDTFNKTLQKNLTLKEQLLQKKELFANLSTTLQKKQLETVQEKKLEFERIALQKASSQKQLDTNTLQQEELTSLLKKINIQIAELRKTVPAEFLVAEKTNIVQQFEERKALYQKWIEQGNWVNNERKNLNQKQRLSQDQDNPSCPLCEQNLSQSRKRFLHKKFSHQTHTFSHRFERLKKYIARLKTALHEQHKQIEQLTAIESLIKQQEDSALKIKTLEKEQEDLTKTIKEQLILLEQKQKELTKFEKEITDSASQSEAYKTLKNEIEILQKQLLELNYDSKQHASAVQALRTIQDRLQLCTQGEQQRTIQKERQQQVHILCCSLKDLTKQQKETIETFKNYSKLEQQEKELQEQEKTLLTTHKKLAEEKEVLLQKKGNLAAQAKKQTELLATQKQQNKELAEQQTELYDLQLITAALGKDGIQALLIEDAIPEIEQEANDLLARLTDNQASITIESLRDLKRGGTRETLDINISDATGIRSYELFSGGEAFRIDFALRIAISKLLARRAGTSLQTLIIDEGFGSQDEEGLQRIMDALYSIQDDFEKIIIVSHLSTMKEQFPVHFYVQKDPQGSHVTVVEHG